LNISFQALITEIKIMKKPTLLYDGDCEFCQYCVDYFRLRTGNQICYQAYQDGTLNRPKAACKKSIQLIINDETFHEGAAAALCALSYENSNRGWWLYKNFLGFRYLAEKIYLYISHHRSLCHNVAKIVCGDPWQVGRLTFITWGLILFVTVTLLTLKKF